MSENTRVFALFSADGHMKKRGNKRSIEYARYKGVTRGGALYTSPGELKNSLSSFFKFAREFPSLEKLAEIAGNEVVEYELVPVRRFPLSEWL